MRNACFFILIVFWAASLAAEVEMILGVDRTEIYEGETIAYQVALIDSMPIGDSVAPDLSAFADFQITSLPKKTTANRQGAQFTYLLTPTKSGTFVLPAPKVSIRGRSAVVSSVQVGRKSVPPGDGSITLLVRAPEVQDIVFMEVETNRQRLYPLQPLTLTLIVQVRELPEGYRKDGNRSPLSALSEPPMLTIPWVEDQSLPKGIATRESGNEWRAAMQTRRTQRGFAINNYGSQSLSINFSVFGNDGFPSRSGFNRTIFFEYLPKVSQIKRKDFEGKEATYWEYRFSRTFLPQEPGRFSFGPVTLKGDFAVLNGTSGDLVARSLYLFAPVVSVEVLDVPRENRPENFVGAFGAFDWTADIQPRKAKVGEPLTLTLRLTGYGSTVNVRPPDLAANAEVARLFKTYPPTENIEDDGCVFTYTIRPVEAGSLVFPSIPVSFFDVEQERFIPVQSGPISLEVSGSAGVQNTVHFTSRSSSVRGELERSEKGLFANMTAPDGAVDQSVSYTRWAATIFSLAVVYVVLFGSVTIWRRLHADPGRRRRNGALGRARRRLEAIRREWIGSDRSSGVAISLCGELRGALCGYVADLCDGAEQGMTTKDACWKLLEMDASEKSVGDARGILEMLDGARYGGVDLRSMEEMVRRSEELLRRLQSEVGNAS